jgi:hypothetical protein
MLPLLPGGHKGLAGTEGGLTGWWWLRMLRAGLLPLLLLLKLGVCGSCCLMAAA